jgi:leucyl-tRNA synthetase
LSGYDPTAIEQRWQQAWQEARLFEPKVEEGRPKFMIIFAYPGISGYLHVGHMRGYSYCDAIARYHRQTGKNVLFPAGFHASGIPAVSFARKVERGDEGTLQALRAEGTPDDVIAKLKDPLFVVDFFKDIYEKKYWRKFGFSIDYTRMASTIDEGYSRFIEWQFRRLNDAGLLVQKPHFAPFCPASGPVAVDASETDVSKGGDAEVLAFTALKFRTEEGVVFPCATLRPETVFGVTNVWVHPSAPYVLAEIQGERWVLSPEALKKAELLFEGGAREVGRVAARDLVGKSVKSPVTGAFVRVFPASFVDPAVGTGVVMSVPAHAPYDFQALEDLRKHPGSVAAEHVAQARPVAMIASGPRGAAGPSAAEAAVRAHKVTGLVDRAALDAATADVYKLEYHQGRMMDNTGAFAGLMASEARERIVREVIEAGEGAPFHEFSKEVICRCGQQVLIKRIPDQWFIRYSDSELTRRSVEHARTMAVTPNEYARDLPNTLEWFADRACIRQGAWLGTRFPLDERWIIEPISDSTLYPVFYLVAPFLNHGRIRAQALSDAFFDFVFLGRGSPDQVPGVDPAVVREARRDFLYWYPLDVNLGGKEHKTVHFPVFIKNHVALLAPDRWPRGIFVNYWLTMRSGGKISKSKGGVEPIADLTSRFGVDALRLYYAHAAAPWLDIEWDPDGLLDYRGRLARIHDAVVAVAGADMAALGVALNLPESPGLDRWLLASLQRRVEELHEGWRSLDFRAVATPVYFSMLSDLRWYARRGGRSAAALREFASAWTAAMAAITPHLAEELHRHLGGAGFASVAPLPVYRLDQRDPGAEFIEDYLQAVIADTQKIRGVAESFAAVNHALAMLERMAGRSVRGELVGRGEPFEIPASVVRDATVGGEKVPAVLSDRTHKVVLFVQGRRAASAEDVERAAKLVAQGAADAGWLVALVGAPAPVREAARQARVLLTGAAEFALMLEEAALPLGNTQPKRILLVTAPKWKADVYARVLKDAASHGRADTGRILKGLSSDLAFRAHMKQAPKVVQQSVEDASQRRAEDLKARLAALETTDEFKVLESAAAFLAEEFECPVQVFSADNPDASSPQLRGKADAAFPLRPAIAIDY